jgi:hypothetical protein
MQRIYDKKVSRQCTHEALIASYSLDEPRGKLMTDENAAPNSAGVWTMILTDVHFWVPVVVLLAGLAVLNWIR